MAGFWAPISYGNAVTYVMRIAGIPVLFAERTFPDMLLPDGFPVVDMSLVVDDSAEIGCASIDREKGLGTGMDLSFKLLDTEIVRQWMRAPSYWATLTADLSATATTFDVDDGSAWPSGGTLYIGQEAMGFERSGNTFGVSRAILHTLPNSYRTGFTAQLVTDMPRSWRGRDVELWAVMVDPSGRAGCDYMDGDTWTQETLLFGPSSKMLWRGRIASTAARDLDGFKFSAQSLDRYLDTAVAGKLSGSITSTNANIIVDPLLVLHYQITAWDAAFTNVLFEYQLDVEPFAALSAGTFLTVQEALEYLKEAWSAEVIDKGADADIGDLQLYIQDDGQWTGMANIVSALTVYSIRTTLQSSIGTYMTPGGGQYLLFTNGQPFLTQIGSASFWQPSSSSNTLTQVTVKLSEGSPDDVPPEGVVMVKGGDVTSFYRYYSVAQSGQSLWLYDLQLMPGQKAMTAAQVSGGSFEISSIVSGKWSDVLLQMLESSGTGLRGSYDLLPKGQGYALPSSWIDEDGIKSALDGTALSSVQAFCAVGGKSLTEAIGGILGLFRLALVLRAVDNNTIKLTVVHTDVASDVVAVLTDDDLLTHAGDPVTSVQRADSPNVVTVVLQPPNESQEPTTLIFTDRCSVDAEGKRETTYTVPTTDIAQMQTLATSTVASHFAADQTGQAAELTIHPSVDTDVGDAISFTSSHPTLWTWSTNPGQPGYDGVGRVTGRTVNPKTGVAKLTVLFDGAIQMHAIAPAMRIIAADTLTHPNWVDVDGKYLKHLQLAMAETAHQLQHYQPGLDEAGTEVTMYSVTLVSGYARIALAANTIVISVSDSVQSTLTLPTRANASTYQQRFAYTSDGSYWS